ncbi:3244_t:CDS:2, partial [Entrophospora sp. SA101]
ASALVNRQRAKYIKIEIPPLPVKDTSGQTSFDQLGVQSKYVPKAISTSSLPYDPNNPNNTNTGDNSLVKVSTALDSNYRTENSPKCGPLGMMRQSRVILLAILLFLNVKRRGE